jgi:hypothetical protein
VSPLGGIPAKPARISGGGIRSATFALGVSESLKRCGLLKNVDYLSTVSGGGFIGGWLTANCRRHEGWLEPGADWTPSIDHLRRYANYLSPKLGFFSADSWSMLTIWARNTLLVQATVILALACALLLPRLMFEPFQHWSQSGNWRWATAVLFVLGVCGVAGNQMRLTSRRARWVHLARRWRLGLTCAAVCLTAAWLYGRRMRFDPFHGGQVDYPAAVPIALLVVLAGFMLQPVAVRVVALVWRQLWPDDDAPQQINYTQNWVQAVVVVPLMIAGYLMAAILWGEAAGLPGAGDGLRSFASYGDLVAKGWRCCRRARSSGAKPGKIC